MKKTQSSTTAQGMAAIRAVESEKSADRRICYDPFARKLIGRGYFLLERAFNAYSEWRSPGLIGFVVCRSRYIDDTLEQCLQKNTKQVVILGAGLDSRAYRVEATKGPVKFFEVDQPATQAAKIARVKRILGAIPPQVIYVPIDFNEESLDKLTAAGYDRSLETLFIWEGVTLYLSREAVDTTLAWVRVNSAPGSSIIFDTIHPSAFAAKPMREELKLSRWTHRLTGEALVFGIEKDTVVDFMVQRGFTRVVDAGAEDLKRMYCTGPNQDRPIADIYSIVHAAVP